MHTCLLRATYTSNCASVGVNVYTIDCSSVYASGCASSGANVSANVCVAC